ncbi:MAG: phenylacetate--CoA ligase family protein [Anaerolineae bacterium]
MKDGMYQPTFEAMPREALTKHQLEKLRGTLRHIHSNNATYANHLHGLGAKDMRSLDDIQKFPFMDKDTLRDAYPFGMACAPQSEFMRMHMSSGTTGIPVINPHTPQDVQQWTDIVARCLTAAGVRRDDVLQITPSFGLFNGGFGFHYGATALETMIIPIGAGRTSLQLQFMRDLGTTAVAAIASYPLRLIEVAAEEGLDFRTDTRLRVAILGAEIWSNEMRQRIESKMGIETFDIIGMTESGGVGMGIDCSEHNGIHVWEDHYLVEFIDSNGDKPVPDGEWGEMVVTTLTRQGLPLIRFRTRDISRVISREKCACGRTAMRVDRIACRNDDMLVVKGVNFYPKQVESILLSHPEVGLDYLIEIDRVKGADILTVRVETAHEDHTVLSERLDQAIYNLLGLHAHVVLQPVGSLPRPVGKAIRVKDRRNHGA